MSPISGGVSAAQESWYRADLSGDDGHFSKQPASPSRIPARCGDGGAFACRVALLADRLRHRRLQAAPDGCLYRRPHHDCRWWHSIDLDLTLYMATCRIA